MPENQPAHKAYTEETTIGIPKRDSKSVTDGVSPTNPPPKPNQRGHTNWRMKGNRRR